MEYHEVDHPYLVNFDGTFSIRFAATTPPPVHDEKKQLKRRLSRAVEAMGELQDRLYGK